MRFLFRYFDLFQIIKRKNYLENFLPNKNSGYTVKTEKYDPF